MSVSQADLFGAPSRGAPPPTEEVVGIVRQQLLKTLEQVRLAKTMPWADQLDIVRADNSFRYGTQALPQTEGEELWNAFSREMDRLYAVMNQNR